MSRSARQRQRWWLLGYSAALLGSAPIALPIWTLWLRDSLGRVVSIEAIHLLQYALLGGLAAWVSAGADGRQRLGWAALIAAVGLCDELAQGLVPGRSFEWSDVGLNLMGGGVGMLAGMIRLPRRGSAG